jgi:hypothetical protein
LAKYLLHAADVLMQPIKGLRRDMSRARGELRLCCLADRRMIRKITANYESYLDSLSNLGQGRTTENPSTKGQLMAKEPKKVIAI